MVNRLVPVALRAADRVVVRDLFGGAAVPRDHDVAVGAFVVRQGRWEVVLKRAGDVWLVTSTTAGRLLGPRTLLHLGRHDRADLAVWDVMARVTKFTHDEDQALKAGSEAALWIRSTGILDDGEAPVLH